MAAASAGSVGTMQRWPCWRARSAATTTLPTPLSAPQSTVAETDNCRPRTRNKCPHEQQVVNGWHYPARTPRSTLSPKLVTVAEADKCCPPTRNNCPHEQQFVNGWLYPARTPRSTLSPKLATVAEADNCCPPTRNNCPHEQQVVNGWLYPARTPRSTLSPRALSTLRKYSKVRSRTGSLTPFRSWQLSPKRTTVAHAPGTIARMSNSS